MRLQIRILLLSWLLGASVPACQKSTSNLGSSVLGSGGQIGAGGGGSSAAVSSVAAAIVQELVANLQSTSLSLTATPLLTATLATQIGAAATAEISSVAGGSTDLTLIMPAAVNGAVGALRAVENTDPAAVGALVGMVVKSVAGSIKGRTADIPEASTADGLSPTVTVLKALARAGTGSLWLAGLPPAYIGAAAQSTTAAAIASISGSGLGSADLVVAVRATMAGAVDGLADLPSTTLLSTALAATVQNITTGATSGISSLTTAGLAADQLTSALAAVTSGATTELPKLSKSTSVLATMTQAVTAGATAGLPSVISALDVSSANAPNLLSAITAGATQALNSVATTVPAVAQTLPAMLTGITTGPAAQLQNAGFSLAQIPNLVAAVATGATGELGSLGGVKGFDYAQVASLAQTIAQSTTASVAQISIAGFTPSATSLASILAASATGATVAINQIATAMPTFLAVDVAGVTGGVANGLVAALANYAAAGMILGSDLVTLASASAVGATSALGSLNIQGLSAISPTTIAATIASSVNTALSALPPSIANFSASAAAATVAAATQSAAASVTIQVFDSSLVSAPGVPPQLPSTLTGVPASANTPVTTGETATTIASGTGSSTSAASSDETPSLTLTGVVLAAGNDALFVSPSGGYVSSDSAYVLNPVTIFNASTSTWSGTALSVGRGFMGVTSVGNYALFAGGQDLLPTANYVILSTVDIYNSATGAWTVANLSAPKYSPTVASVGTKAMFAGGFNETGASSSVDIYDTATGSWSLGSLSQAKYAPTPLVVGTKALFAGGLNGASHIFSSVDIYDSAAGSWSTASLSQARIGAAGAAVGTKGLFAGGETGVDLPYSSVVDIYDSAAGTWSTASLSQARAGIAAATVGAKVLFAGGILGNAYTTTLSNVVDIYDSSTGHWTTATLSQARGGLTAVTVGTKVLFTGSYGSSVNCGNPIDLAIGTSANQPCANLVDIYDSISGLWSTAALSQIPEASPVTVRAASSPGLPVAAAVTVGNWTFFPGTQANQLDVYDATTGSFGTTLP